MFVKYCSVLLSWDFLKVLRFECGKLFRTSEDHDTQLEKKPIPTVYSDCFSTQLSTDGENLVLVEAENFDSEFKISTVHK